MKLLQPMSRKASTLRIWRSSVSIKVDARSSSLEENTGQFLFVNPEAMDPKSNAAVPTGPLHRHAR
jgi:hypothetical protein